MEDTRHRNLSIDILYLLRYRMSTLSPLRPIPIFFWSTGTGHEPVRVFLRSLSADDKKKAGLDLAQLQFGWPIGMPLVRKIRGDIWELRSSLPSKRELRILFVFADNMLVLLHCFIKKTAKTPVADLNLADKRWKDLKT